MLPRGSWRNAEGRPGSGTYTPFSHVWSLPITWTGYRILLLPAPLLLPLPALLPASATAATATRASAVADQMRHAMVGMASTLLGHHTNNEQQRTDKATRPRLALQRSRRPRAICRRHGIMRRPVPRSVAPARCCHCSWYTTTACTYSSLSWYHALACTYGCLSVGCPTVSNFMEEPNTNGIPYSSTRVPWYSPRLA
jgi:hypothetical protein